MPTAGLCGSEQQRYLVGDLGPEEPARPAGADGPRVHVLRVRPHQVAEGAFVRDLLVPLNGPDLVQGLDVWGEASVHTQNLLVY